MDQVNWNRVVLGGSIAAVVLMALASITTALFIGQHRFVALLLALVSSTNGRALPLVVFAFLFLGILMTALHAAIVPRFGSGPKTAALAGFTVWLIGVSLSVVGFVVKSLVLGEAYPLPSGPMLPGICLGILIASTLAGALIYKEQQG